MFVIEVNLFAMILLENFIWKIPINQKLDSSAKTNDDLDKKFE